MSPANPDLSLTAFGHSVKAAVHETLQKAAEAQSLAGPGFYDSEDERDLDDAYEKDPPREEPCFTTEATTLIGAHVALVMEKCRIERLEAWGEYVKAKHAEKAIADVVKEGAPAGKKSKVKNPVVLREQILANAQTLAIGLDLAGLQSLNWVLKEMVKEQEL
nr:hypothetical protein B0A51_04273 [Rachicladosporium sp. CCFEE 5018]